MAVGLRRDESAGAGLGPPGGDPAGLAAAADARRRVAGRRRSPLACSPAAAQVARALEGVGAGPAAARPGPGRLAGRRAGRLGAAPPPALRRRHPLRHRGAAADARLPGRFRAPGRGGGRAHRGAAQRPHPAPARGEPGRHLGPPRPPARHRRPSGTSRASSPGRRRRSRPWSSSTAPPSPTAGCWSRSPRAPATPTCRSPDPETTAWEPERWAHLANQLSDPPRRGGHLRGRRWRTRRAAMAAAVDIAGPTPTSPASSTCWGPPPCSGSATW